MPELPDVTVYAEALRRFARNLELKAFRLASPFFIRSVETDPQSLVGTSVRSVHTIGKRIVLEFDDEMFVVVHLMIAGRMRWKKAGAKIPGKVGLAAWDFDTGSLIFTEAGSQKRASMHVVTGGEALRSFDRGGADVFAIDGQEFAQILRRENHTLKRCLTDPRLFSGIGNAYSDEILHAARLSPIKLSARITDEEVARLYAATRDTLSYWIDKTRNEVGEGFPDKVTAFREGMATHGRYKKPCPICTTPIQRIRYAQNETNYCPTCQTEGRLLADRSLSRLLKKDWPRSLDELDEWISKAKERR